MNASDAILGPHRSNSYAIPRAYAWRPRRSRRPSPSNVLPLSTMVSASSSDAVRVTRRNRSERVPTRPKVHASLPDDTTVSTRMGSSKMGPVTILPMPTNASSRVRDGLAGVQSPMLPRAISRQSDPERSLRAGPIIARKRGRQGKLGPTLCRSLIGCNALCSISGPWMHCAGSYRLAGLSRLRIPSPGLYVIQCGLG